MTMKNALESLVSVSDDIESRLMVLDQDKAAQYRDKIIEAIEIARSVTSRRYLIVVNDNGNTVIDCSPGCKDFVCKEFAGQSVSQIVDQLSYVGKFKILIQDRMFGTGYYKPVMEGNKYTYWHHHNPDCTREEAFRACDMHKETPSRQ